MDSVTSDQTGGDDRILPVRGQVQYTPRQSSYFTSQHETTNTPPALQQVIQPDHDQVKNNPQPIVNQAGSFDMLVPAKPTPPPASESMQKIPTQPIFQNEYKRQPIQSVSYTPPVDYFHSSFNENPEQKLKKHRSLKFQLPAVSTLNVLVSAAILIFISGGVVAFLGFRTNKDATAQVKSVQTNTKNQDDDGGISEGIPHEDGNPPSVEYYRVTNSYPRVIRIGKTNTEARVLSLGIATTGALKSPGNIFDAGWYKDSSKPGEPGAMVIDGHVSGPSRPGVFKDLGKLVMGDKIEIERGDGQKFTYTVTDTKIFDADKLDMSSVMVPSVPGKPGLNIITCGGKFDKATNKYEQRTVVYAVIE